MYPLTGDIQQQVISSVSTLGVKTTAQYELNNLTQRPSMCIQSNPCPLIARLPPDILQVIFTYCASDHYTSNNGDLIKTVPSWVNVSYVCRYWRDVALTCPALWSYLFIASSCWTEELLARSKQAPLKVQVNSISREENNQALYFMGKVMDHLERIEELHLEIFDRSQEEMFYPTLASRAPRLRNLTIIVKLGPPTQQFPVFFEGDTPSLCMLKLSGCSVPWYSFGLRCLTSLSLYNVPVQDRKSMAEFLPVLHSMQYLENLDLRDAINGSTGFPSGAKPHAPKKVDLPRLSRFFIAASLSTVIAFLTSVNMPLKAELRLDCNYEDGFSFRDCTLLFLVVQKRHAGPIYHSLVIDMATTMTSITFSALELDFEPLRYFVYQWGCYNPLKIRIALGSPLARSDETQILDDVFSLVPLPDVHAVHVLSPPFPPDFWRMTLGRLPNLRSIRLSSGKMPDLASVLSLTNPTDNEDQSGPRDRILAPALEELELFNITLSMRQKHAGVQLSDLQSLWDALATRKAVPGRFTVKTFGIPVLVYGYKRIYIVGEWNGGHLCVKKVHHSRGLRL